MPDDDRVRVVELLQPGVTRPHVDHAARASWLTAVHDAIRTVGGVVTVAAEEPTVGRNHYRVSVTTRDGGAKLILLNAAALLVAAAEGTDPQEITPVFADVPGSEFFAGRGFHVAGPAELNAPLSGHHLRALAADERRDVAYHDPPRLGDLLFNCFD